MPESVTPYQTTFKLTKDYLAESFDQSLPHGCHANPNFVFPAVLFAAGAGLLIFTDQPGIAGWAFVALCVLELLHIKFRRGWWLFRQTWGKNNELDIHLTIDESGIRTQSSASETHVKWSEITGVIETNLGVLLVTDSGDQQYISKSILDKPSLERILNSPTQSTST